MSYALSLPIGMLQHFPGYNRFVRDGIDFDNLEIEAQARSGDYLEMLIAELETIISKLGIANDPERERLESLIRGMLYVDHRYKLTKR